MHKNISSSLNSKEVKGFARGHMETKLDKFISDLEMMAQSLRKQGINLIGQNFSFKLWTDGASLENTVSSADS